MQYTAPLDDFRFVLNELFGVENLWQEMGLEIDAALAGDILEEAGKICSQLIAPLNRPGDEQGVSWHNGTVSTPEGYKHAFETYAQAGWVGLGGDPEFGGQGMPKTVTLPAEEMLQSASNAFALYAILTAGAAFTINHHASQNLKQQYLPKLYSGEWAGVMCLTESHAGTDLGLIRTRAEDNQDGSYAISGTKIFITGGEQDLTDNIVHLVLARLPDAPAGSRGISLFLVPKFLPDAEGNPGERNAVNCGSVEHKMGIHASSTCVMNFDGAKGFLIGEPNQGLACMFTMMNYERLSVGLQGTGCAETAYQNALAYCRERLQSRNPQAVANPEGEADPIINHADVRRMLLTQKALLEAGRAFSVEVAIWLDRSKYLSGEQQQYAERRVALLTPLAKAFMTDTGFESCVIAQQCFGGHGYIREWGMEQLVRDARIGQIYEGTNGIQSHDLLGRKVIRDQGKALREWLQEQRELLAGCAQHEILSVWAKELEAKLDKFEQTSSGILNRSSQDPHLMGALACEYLHLMGYLQYAVLWLRMMSVALHGGAQTDLHQSKLQTGEFYLQRILPRVEGLFTIMDTAPELVSGVPEELF